MPVANAPWTAAQPIATLNDELDCSTIGEIFQKARLRVDHPIVLAWNKPCEESRRLLHQIAEDARQLRNVPGFGDLCKKIRSDLDGFADSVYELRLAGALARGAEQTVVRLGGSKSGPDIVFRSRSGHECGVACYKARSAPPDILEVKPLVDSVAERFFRMFTFRDIGANVYLPLLFPEFPVRPIDETAAMVVLGQLWGSANGPQYEFEGVSGRREVFPSELAERGDRRRVRVRLEFPVSEWDQRRVLSTVTKKIQFEVDRWAADFSGIPIFAVEESDGAHGGSLLPDALRTMMKVPGPFAGVLLTHRPTAGLENV